MDGKLILMDGKSRRLALALASVVGLSGALGVAAALAGAAVTPLAGATTTQRAGSGTRRGCDEHRCGYGGQSGPELQLTAMSGHQRR